MKAAKSSAFALALIMITIFSLFASAHAPLGTGDSRSIAGASLIPDPAKSWAIYSSLEPVGDARYYMFDIEEGERIYISLIVSAGSRSAGFLPDFALMGPNLTNEYEYLLPSFVERPSEVGTGIIVVDGEFPATGTFEPFSPSGYYEVAELDIDAPASGDYYVVVFEEPIGGNFGLAVGYLEEFTIEEWIFLPFTLLSIYEWSGMNIALVLAPIVIVLVLGFAWMYIRYSRKNTPKTAVQWMSAAAGLLALSWGASVVFQMLSAMTYTMLGSEIIITVGFAAASILIGIYMMQTALKDRKKIPRGNGILLIVFGGLMIAFLSGFLIGPILAIIAGVSTFFSEKKENDRSMKST